MPAGYVVPGCSELKTFFSQDASQFMGMNEMNEMNERSVGVAGLVYSGITWRG
jgi:hypothetical protein